MNKTISIVINAVLVVAVIVLFVLVLNKKETKSSAEEVREKVQTGEVLPVAYINVDSLLLQYQFAVDANEALMRKQEDARLKINTQARKLQADMEEFQRKLENNAFLSRERAEQEQTRILQKQQELQNLDAKLTEELMVEQQNMSLQLRDTINNFLKEFNADGRYHMIISNTAGDNLLQANEEYNITAKVVAALNKRCAMK